MSSLSTVEAKLPPGFRFHPRDEELICDYLMNWVGGCSPPLPLLIEVDLNKCEPWDIPAVACVGGKEWYFYSQRDRKYATGLRTNRATVSGYWKATGKDRPIFRKGSFLVGMRKTLVFYQGRAPKGKKTDWVMHEFRIQQGPSPPTPTPREDWVLCRVFYKSRSELIASKLQETASMMKEAVTPRSSFSAASLPPLMGFEPTADQAGPSDNEQVPCFSIFVNHQTNPSFSLMDPPPAELIHPDVGNYINPPPPLMNSSDNKMMSVVLHHLTKMESSGNEEMSIIKGGSPSFGEGSSDSYLSEVGSLSSMWNHYS